MPSTAIKLVALREGEALAQYTLVPGEYLVGRDPACPVHVDSPEVSRKHAKLIVGKSLEIEDVGGRYGTFIDNQKITGRQIIRPGQTLHVGATEISLSEISFNEEVIAPSHPDADTRYKTIEVIAQGGMSQVALAHDHHLQRKVALKILTPEMANSPGLCKRFTQEALVLGRLEHPHIIPIHDLGTDSQGRNFYTMKYVRGTNLKEVLDDLRKGRTNIIRKFPLTELLSIYQKICDAMAFAHSQGIIHRDLKPANIMLGEYGEVLVTDWGLAKIIGEPEPDPDTVPPVAAPATIESKPATRYGTIMGTPNFMAPEQADGRLEDIDIRTDVFALGAILYNILTLRPPVAGANEKEVLEKIRTGKIEPPANFNDPKIQKEPGHTVLLHLPDRRVPEALSAVAMQALSRKPSGRYACIEDLQKDIAAYQDGFATQAEHAGKFRQMRLTFRRHRTLATAVAIIAFLLIGFSVHSFFTKRELKETLARERNAAPAYYQAAQGLVAEKKFNAALQHINHAVELAPDSPEFQQLKGNIHQSLLQLPKARDAFAKVVQLDASRQVAAENLQLSTRILTKVVPGNPVPIQHLEQLRQRMTQQGRAAEVEAMALRITQAGHKAMPAATAFVRPYGANRLTQDSRGLLKVNLADTNVRDLTPIAGMPIVYLNLWHTPTSTITPLAGMPLEELYVAYTNVGDLQPLSGMPLKSLTAAYSTVSDITPLQGLPLVYLYLSAAKVTNLNPLKGMRLQWLHLDHTPITNIAPLTGMPLKKLRLDGCNNLTDLTPLSSCTQLEELILPPRHGNINFLKKLPNLQRISYVYNRDPMKIKSAANFWRTRN